MKPTFNQFRDMYAKEQGHENWTAMQAWIKKMKKRPLEDLARECGIIAIKWGELWREELRSLIFILEMNGDVNPKYLEEVKKEASSQV